jgi:Pin2-interacting protein X1
LNGKSEDTLETERKAREDLKRNLYVEKKIGTIRFVKGGWLVGDQVKDEPAKDEPVEGSAESSATSPEEAIKSLQGEKKPKKKRKVEEEPALEDSQSAKTEKKPKRRKLESASDPTSEDQSVEKAETKKKLKTKSKASGGLAAVESLAEEKATPTPQDNTEDLLVLERKREKKEKREKRKDKKRRKGKDESGLESRVGENSPKEKQRRKDRAATSSSTEEATDSATRTSVSTPVPASGFSTPNSAGAGRYLARQRFIAQKKMAFSDPAALNQVRSRFRPTIAVTLANWEPDIHDKILIKSNIQ